eukprot:TRINITY_DN6703_c0_g1_i1.p1 TRINITY_DN6703_c0_g1~~TRINITY_DN6703_c0_g1_i1.p1  ORF type:complete len:226 (-),score=69.20 TRINITY_DN6703_c0_g1_i1:230-907(-)
MSITLEVTHSAAAEFKVLKQYPPTITIKELKSKLQFVVGTEPKDQLLELRDGMTKSVVAKLDDDTKTLQDYGAQESQIIHVVDTNPVTSDLAALQFGDASAVRFELSEEQEKARKERMAAAKAAKAAASPAKVGLTEEQEKELVSKINVGDEVLVKSDAGQRKGTVQFVGKVEFGPGYWVGVMFPDPVGKNDGSVKGTRYFTCEPNHGSFCRPHLIEVVPKSAEF